MPFPNLQTGRTDRFVTNVLLAYTNPDYLAGEILPNVPNLTQETGLIPQLGNAHLRSYSTKRSLYDESMHRMQFTYSQNNRYNIDYYDLEVYVPDRVAGQLQVPFDARRDASFSLMQAMMLEREINLAATMHSTSVITNNIVLSGTSKFSDYINSDPNSVIETARTTIQNAIAREANSCVMSRQVANILKTHPFFLDLAKRNAGMNVKNLNLSTFVELFKSEYELDNVYIAKSIYVNSGEGLTETKAVVWNNDLVFFNTPSSPALMAPSFGYSFSMAGQDKRVVIRRHPNDKGDLIEVDWAYQDFIIDTNAGYLIQSAI